KGTSVAAEVGAKITQQRVEAVQREEHERFGGEGDVQRELPKLSQELVREERRRVLPGYVRRFTEKAAPLVDVGLDGDPDSVFSWRARRAHALDRFLPLLDASPPERRNRLSVKKPPESARAVFFHPGEPVFDWLQTSITSRFQDDALRGGVFV